MQSNQTRILMSDADVAAMLGISKASVWRHARDGALPRPFKIGGSTRWDATEIDAAIERARAARDAA